LSFAVKTCPVFIPRAYRRNNLFKSAESPITRRAGGLDFSAIGGKIQRHASALIGASNTVEPWILVQSTRFENTQLLLKIISYFRCGVKIEAFRVSRSGLKYCNIDSAVYNPQLVTRNKFNCGF
jgi:hypothetical protein